MRYKYEFEADEWFEQGDCHRCPFSYLDDELNYKCPLLHNYTSECPLKRVED